MDWYELSSNERPRRKNTSASKQRPCKIATLSKLRSGQTQCHWRTAWAAGIGLGALTIPAALAVCAVVFSLPVWIAWWWLVRHG